MQDILSGKNKVIHLVGIGGVSMSALAEVLIARGLSVRGSDMNNGVYVERLKEKGVEVINGHFSDNVDGADVVIRTSAIKDDNPEIERARNLGIPILERAQAWGIIMRDFPEVICVSGTHGKTSTTAMITNIALSAGRDPEVMIGADMREIGGVVRISDGSLFIAEACEYCNSFLNFNPTVAVLLNIEEDHLDFFSGLDDIINSFGKFVSGVKKGGVVVANADDENVMRAVATTDKTVITFGIENNADVVAKDIQYENGLPSYTLVYKGEQLGRVKLSVLGEHNVKNSLAAASAALSVGIDFDSIQKALLAFCGVGRRMEYKGECNGAKVYDDYAHHPSEITASLSAVKKAHSGRLICIFQPHTYTRTTVLCDDFAKALSLADEVILADIYAAREKNIIGITSKAIGDKIKGAKCISSFDDITNEVRKSASDGDFILTMGAGDIYKVGEKLCKKR